MKKNMKYIYYKNTKIGKIGIQEENGNITKLGFKLQLEEEGCKEKETLLIKEAFKQIEEYIKGTRKEFDLPLNPEGTEFRKKVWRELRKIPYGKTVSYGAIAKNIGNPKASRAVGGANNKNPIAIIIPCHRVIGSNGKLVGYAGGLDIKQKLLEIEEKYGK